MSILEMTAKVLISLRFAVSHHKLTNITSNMTNVDASYAQTLEAQLFVVCLHVASSCMSVAPAVICTCQWFGEGLQIGWPHLELRSGPTLSSLLAQDNYHYKRRLDKY